MAWHVFTPTRHAQQTREYALMQHTRPTHSVQTVRTPPPPMPLATASKYRGSSHLLWGSHQAGGLLGKPLKRKWFRSPLKSCVQRARVRRVRARALTMRALTMRARPCVRSHAITIHVLTIHNLCAHHSCARALTIHNAEVVSKSKRSERRDGHRANDRHEQLGALLG